MIEARLAQERRNHTLACFYALLQQAEAQARTPQECSDVLEAMMLLYTMRMEINDAIILSHAQQLYVTRRFFSLVHTVSPLREVWEQSTLIEDMPRMVKLLYSES